MAEKSAKRIEIDGKLYQSIKDYCELNGLRINIFVNSLLKKAFNREKFGDSPFYTRKEEDTEEKQAVKDTVKCTLEKITDNTEEPVVENKVEQKTEKAEPEVEEVKPKKRIRKLN